MANDEANGFGTSSGGEIIHRGVGRMFIDLLLNTQPAGYGGPAAALNRPGFTLAGEIWYMDCAEIDADPGADAPAKAPQCPPFGLLKRGQCPFLTFTRSGSDLRLESVGKEWVEVLDRLGLLSIR